MGHRDWQMIAAVGLKFKVQVTVGRSAASESTGRGPGRVLDWLTRQGPGPWARPRRVPVPGPGRRGLQVRVSAGPTRDSPQWRRASHGGFLNRNQGDAFV